MSGLSDSRTNASVQPREAQVSTFYLLWCERCGHAAEPEPPVRQPEFGAPTTEAMRCVDCNEFLHLVECFTASQTTMWHEKPGAAWHHVIYPSDLPPARWPKCSPGRQIWVPDA